MTVNPGTVVTGPVPGPQNLTETLLSGGGFMHGLADAEKGELKAVIAGRVISGLVTRRILGLCSKHDANAPEM
jgi:hypothetical protein